MNDEKDQQISDTELLNWISQQESVKIECVVKHIWINDVGIEKHCRYQVTTNGNKHSTLYPSLRDALCAHISASISSSKQPRFYNQLISNKEIEVDS